MQFDNGFVRIDSQTLEILNASNTMDATLLITGSTGTGKSHLAHQVHLKSLKRSKTKFVKINLATLSENLIESELFGHEKGAFTGADFRRIGKLEICNGGTVFLDEIGELPLRLQSKLLDFIQYKIITPVGSNKEVALDVRIIAATNKNLAKEVQEGKFREDLFHRLNIFHVKLPNLSQMPDQILSFAKHFLEIRSQKVQKNIRALSMQVMQVFQDYPWPGNIRELENVIEFAIGVETETVLNLRSLPPFLKEFALKNLNLTNGVEMKSEAPVEECSANQEREELQSYNAESIGLLKLPLTLDYHECRDAFEKAYLLKVLRVCNGHINLTSRSIGLNKVSLTDKIRKYSIDWRQIRFESKSEQEVQ